MIEKTPEALFKTALKCMEQDQSSQAIAYLWELMDKDPDFPEAKHYLGLLMAKQGSWQQALDLLLDARKLDPENPSLENHLATIYKHLNQDNEALLHYQKAVQLQPEYAEAQNNLATLYSQKGSYTEALRHYREAIHAAPDLLPAHFNLGLLFLKMRNAEAAKVQFANVLSLYPQHPGATFYWGVLLLENNQPDEAAEAFQQVLQYQPEHVEALCNLGVIALKKEQNQLAIDFFTKALALDNSHIEARNNLAATFIHHDRFENALTHYNILLQHEPDNQEYHYNAGVAQMALGHLDEAINHFDQVLQKNAKHNAALSNLAAIYLKKNDPQQAKYFLNQAIAINPDDESSKHMLNALNGNTHAASSPAYATGLFNNYAIYYDNHMQGALKYTLPEHIRQLIHEWHLSHFNHILDAGCGTGLCGLALREYGTHLTGVDISFKMLAEARKKGIYNTLHEAELLTFLTQDEKQYDLIVIADVLPYFGDLKPLFMAVYEHLPKEGYFIFSTEISEQQPWMLQTNARFSHHPLYIQDLCKESGFTIIEQKKIPARFQNNEALFELLCLVQK